MRLIPLTRGLYAKVDDADYELVSQHKWFAFRVRKSNKFYAMQLIRGKWTLMHRLILGADGPFVDHIDGDGTNNQRANLRHATNSQNQANRGSVAGTTSQYKGVYRTESHRWHAIIQAEGKKYRLGLFDSEEDAARAYDSKAIELHGDFARLNFPIVK